MKKIISILLILILIVIGFSTIVNADTDTKEIIKRIELKTNLNPKYGEMPTFQGELLGDTKDLLNIEEYWTSVYGKSTKFAYISSNEEHNGYIKEDEKLYGESYANPIFLDKFEDGEYVYSIEISIKDTSKYKITKATEFIVDGKKVEIYDDNASGIMYRSETYKLGNYVSDDVTKKEENEATKVINKMLNSTDGIELKNEERYNKAIAENQEIVAQIELNKLSQKEIESKSKDDGYIEKVNAIMTNDNELIAYYDINIWLNTKNDIEEKNSGFAYARELPEEIEISLPIPSDLPKLESGKERKFYVIRVHNGVAEKIETKNNNNGTITFKSDKFSIYATIYEDIDSTFQLGDVNKDDKVSIEDAIEILKKITGKKKFTETEEKAADTNKDGKVSIEDAIQILKKITGKIKEF